MARKLAERCRTGLYHLSRVKSKNLLGAADRKMKSALIFSSVSTFGPDLRDSSTLLVRGHSRLTDPVISYR